MISDGARGCRNQMPRLIQSNVFVFYTLTGRLGLAVLPKRAIDFMRVT